MTQKDIFQIAVRIVGLIVFLYGLEAVYEAVLYAAGSSEVNDPRLGRLYAMRGALEIVLSVFLMRGGAPLVALAFPSETQQQSDSHPKDPNDAA